MSVRDSVHRNGSGIFQDEDENWEHPSGYVQPVAQLPSSQTSHNLVCIHGRTQELQAHIHDTDI
jgi:hypothetical protein